MFSYTFPKYNFLNARSCNRYISFFELFSRRKSNDFTTGDHNINIQLEAPFKFYKLQSEPEKTVSVNKNTATNLYRQMQIIRRFENACANLYREKIIRGFCHLYAGQEACCVGIKASMRPQDTVISAYRAHGWTWIMGVSVHALIAELCQKQSGCSRGKGGSMHTYAPNFFGGNGIVGAQTPLGAGVALAHAYRADGGVNINCYGDGAANQGQLYETFNIACLWKLPVVFVCENNKYGLGTSARRSSCNTDYYTRGDYIPGLWVNGNDVLAVQNAAKFAIEHAASCGPIVMELETYRYFGHSMSDPGTSYRKREEVEMMREKNDPIIKFKALCLKNNLISEAEFMTIDEALKKEVDAAVEQARQDEDTKTNELAIDVYAKNLEGYIRNILERDLNHRNVGTRLVPQDVGKAAPIADIRPVSEKEKLDQIQQRGITLRIQKQKKQSGNDKGI